MTAQPVTFSVRPEVNGEDLAEILRTGPFARAFRAAIAARGLGLERIQDRLHQHGIKLSIATLSYWQSGHRHPSRAESLRALKLIEGILELPAGSLSSLLRSSTRRDIRPMSDGIPHPWPERPEFAELLSDIPTTPDTALRRLHQRDRVTIGPDGLIRSTICSQVMRAERDGVDRSLFLFGCQGHAGDDLPLVTNLRNCELGHVSSNPGHGLIGGEFVFERPLRKGETIRIEYQVDNPPEAADAQHRTESFSRCFMQAVPVYLVELCFDERALPRRCQQFKGRLSENSPRITRNLELGIANTVWSVGRNFGPGYFGIHWDSESAEDDGEDSLVDWSSHWSCNVV